MVTVKAYHIRQKEGEEGSFISLELNGDLELVQSQKTGRHYATVRRCFISSTFDEPVAKTMVGRQIPGTIGRVPCDEYEYTVPETGEVVLLAHRWDYVPEGMQTTPTREMAVM